ncbi:putative zinc finger/FHA domain protein [Gregarina niphandrodes]|uniref:Zinc finger/FHA domain protein n=1 Tax=Gregarina niphandrodes TaxID=110365 RepID=A0A023BDZ9_GRENI|nr:putative zinc finger/FHA domain protein [Gregarina niphandrodes]EZG89040.1 putative zinc finger/FHA domain protein [Gregarina niphandrodes]|eukprot:XP_011128509.1 putative zinc finger/FHA domain protein [Gregarina niphandrodes]
MADATDLNNLDQWQPATTTTASEGPLLNIDYRTWHRDSHELYDYESLNIFRGRHSTRRSVRVIRSGTDVILDEDATNLPAQGDFLLGVKAKDGKFIIFPADRSVQYPQTIMPRKLWLITRYLPNSLYPLSEGDVIKLGRFKLRVKQIVSEDRPNTLVDWRLDDSEFPVAELSPEEALNTQCRICLTEGAEENNPLVRACHCKGSIMYVHLECLRQWVNGRLNLSEDLSRACCFVRQIQCELCKATFPSFVTSKGERLPVVKIPQLQSPFIVLENMVGPVNKGVHLCSLAQKKECKLGRGHESDVRIADVSISRWHATIKYSEGQFNLEDHSSKFGTLVALRRPVIMDSLVERLSVQIGRTVMDLGVSGSSEAATELSGVPANALRSSVLDHEMEPDWHE